MAPFGACICCTIFCLAVFRSLVHQLCAVFLYSNTAEKFAVQLRHGSHPLNGNPPSLQRTRREPFAMFGRSVGSPISTGSDVDVETKAVTETNVRADPQRGGVQIVDDHEENDLSRSLSQRHIQMIALAGAIVRRPAVLCQWKTDTSRERDSSSVSGELSKLAVHSALCLDML